MINSIKAWFQWIIQAWMFIVPGLIIGFLCFATCTVSPSKASEYLGKHGYTEIKTEGIAVFPGCGETESTGRNFSARTPSGTVVNGYVCCTQFWGGCHEYTE